MTYTFKLARRLAVSREYAMLSVMAVLVACAGETTAPDIEHTTRFPASLPIRVVPSAVTIEINQKVRFRGEHLGPRGERRSVPLFWQVTGGAIDAYGYFTASASGTYKVIGRGRGRNKSDTSTVVVVPRQKDLTDISVTPDTISLEPSSSHTFEATGILRDGTTVPIGVTWKATGGTIDAGGLYSAGATPGSYRVIATNTEGTLVDTSRVTIPEPPSAPTLAQVVLKPTSVSLLTGATKQFHAYGQNSLGDSVAVQVTFSATGGTITSSGLYTAGGTAGTYRVVASAGGLADTSVTTIAESTTPTGKVGQPFGPSQQLARTGSIQSPFSLTMDAYSPSNIVSRIAAARSGGYKLLLALPGGSHDNFMSVIDGVYQFDGDKYRAAMDRYNTATIRQAVAEGVKDGTVVAANIMDEPYVSGGASGGGNTWGPKGTMTKARVDSLCGYVKGIFTTLAAGPEHQHHLFEPTKSYRVCDFFIDQYAARFGDVTAFRDAGLTQAARDGISVMFAMNILDGGVQDKDGTYDCTGPGQGGKGTYSPNCRMTPAQVRDWGALLGAAGCGALYMWRYDDTFVSNSDNQRAFKDLGAKLATVPWRSCAKS